MVYNTVNSGPIIFRKDKIDESLREKINYALYYYFLQKEAKFVEQNLYHFRYSLGNQWDNFNKGVDIDPN